MQGSGVQGGFSSGCNLRCWIATWCGARDEPEWFSPGQMSERERYGVDGTTHFGVLEVGVLHDLMFEVVLRKVSSMLNEIQW